MRPRAAVLLACLVLLVVAPRHAAAGDPTRKWRTIESAHFVVNYYEPLGDVARRIAVVAERAHRTLTRALDHTPSEKTQIVVYDDNDGANGFASVLPRNQITLYASAANAGSVLADHDDWLYGLVAHEYTHIIHLDTIGGLPVLYNRLVGKTWAPNQTMPRWIIEGIATYEESKRSSAGRTRATQFDMWLRVPTLRGEALGLDEVTGAPVRFPRGNAAYLYGAYFLKYVFDRYGDDALRRMSWSAGSSTIPFGINRQISEAVGTSFDALWGDWQRHLRDRATLQLESVERHRPRAGRRLTVVGEVERNPRYSPDGRELYWLESDGVRKQWIRAMPVGGHGGRARDVRFVDRIGTFDVAGDGAVVYEQTQAYRDVNAYQDLYRWDPASDRVERLTKAERAREPALARDGDRIVYSRNGRSRSELVVMDRKHPAQRTVIWRGARFDQAFNPAWSPDGTRVAFTAWRKGGLRDVMIVAADGTGTPFAITSDRALDGDAQFSPDGRWLYFTSDRTGIENVFAYELATGATWQVTNLIGGVTEMGLSPDGKRLAYGDFVGSGWDLYELALDPARWTPARPYVDDRPDATVVRDDEVAVSAPRRYRALETLAPRSFTAQLAVGSFGRTLTVQTGGDDVAGLHGYVVGTTVELERGDVDIGASYGYAGYRPGLRVAFGRAVAHRTSIRIDNHPRAWTEELMSGTVSVGIPTRRNDESSLSLSLDYDVDWFRRLDGPVILADPTQLLPGVPLTDYRTAGLAVRAGFGNARGFLYGVGASEGMEASASVRVDHPALGATYRALLVNWFWRGYWKLPWGASPSLAVRLTGGIRASELARGAAFALGGVPSQDVARSIIDSTRVSPTGYLRGYPQRTIAGNTYHLLNIEYRHQLLEIEKGASTLPFYVRRLHAALLVDGGTAYDGNFDPGAVRWSVGATLRLDVFVGYFVPGAFELGYSHGLSQDGEGEGWFLLSSSI